MAVGLRFGRFGTDDPDYACRACGERLRRQHHVCPNCGSFSVDPIDDVEGSH